MSTFTQDHRVTEELDLVQSFRCKVARNSPNFSMVDDSIEMTAKKPWRYGEQGQFEHLFFLFIIVGAFARYVYST